MNNRSKGDVSMLLIISTVVYWIVVEKEIIEIQTRVSTSAAAVCSADCSFEKSPFSRRENWKLKLAVGLPPPATQFKLFGRWICYANEAGCRL